jgi:hypothetical protein
VVHSSTHEEELMDQAVVQFQKAAARENRDRGSMRRRYSSTLQQQAVEYCRERQRQGDGRRDVAAALGVAPWSLYRWTRASEERARFHQVQVARPAVRSGGAAPVVIMTADGLRVEGLDVDAAAQLLRLLR